MSRSVRKTDLLLRLKARHQQRVENVTYAKGFVRALLGEQDWPAFCRAIWEEDIRGALVITLSPLRLERKPVAPASPAPSSPAPIVAAPPIKRKGKKDSN
jgi:hypothetical protein